LELKDSDLKGARLLAIRIRLAELSHEMHQTQIRVHHLESQLEDARLAQMVGGEAGDPAAIGPELEQSRAQLERQRAFIDGVKKNQMKAGAQWAVARMQEKKAEREREE
jgi:hypothetical protein